MKKQIECSICNNTFYSENLEPVQIVHCSKCCNGTTIPRPSFAADSDAIWRDTYNGQRVERRDTWIKEAYLRLNWMHLYKPNGSILEVGCGTGEFLEVASDNGHEAYGVEPSVHACMQARDHGAFVINAELASAMDRFRDYRFDSIAMWHSLEHIPNPVECLKDCSNILADDGKLFIEVPNYDSYDRKRLGATWQCADPSQHYHHFSKTGIAEALRYANLKPDYILEFTPRIYWSPASWKGIINRRMLDNIELTSNDYLRIVASKARNDRPH